MITFTYKRKHYYLKSYRGDFKIIEKAEDWDTGVVVGFNDYQGFMSGYGSHNNWIQEHDVILANEEIKAYWKVNTRKVENWNKDY